MLDHRQEQDLLLLQSAQLQRLGSLSHVHVVFQVEMNCTERV
jgi:hypothetical protein